MKRSKRGTCRRKEGKRERERERERERDVGRFIRKRDNKGKNSAPMRGKGKAQVLQILLR